MSVLYLTDVFEHVVERLAHLGFEALVDFLFLPEVAVAILDPLEIRRGDAAGVGEDVGNHEDAAFVQVLVRLRASSGRWRPSATIFALMTGAFSIVIWFSSAAGTSTSTSRAKSCIVLDRLAAGEAVDRLVLLRVVEHLRDVEAVGVVDAPFPVGDRDDLRADLREQIRRDRADVAEPLDRDASRP